MTPEELQAAIEHNRRVLQESMVDQLLRRATETASLEPEPDVPDETLEIHRYEPESAAQAREIS